MVICHSHFTWAFPGNPRVKLPPSWNILFCVLWQLIFWSSSYFSGFSFSVSFASLFSLCVNLLSYVQLFVTPWSIAHWAPLPFSYPGMMNNKDRSIYLRYLSIIEMKISCSILALWFKYFLILKYSGRFFSVFLLNDSHFFPQYIFLIDLYEGKSQHFPLVLDQWSIWILRKCSRFLSWAD